MTVLGRPAGFMAGEGHDGGKFGPSLMDWRQHLKDQTHRVDMDRGWDSYLRNSEMMRNIKESDITDNRPLDIDHKIGFSQSYLGKHKYMSRKWL